MTSETEGREKQGLCFQDFEMDGEVESVQGDLVSTISVREGDRGRGSGVRECGRPRVISGQLLQGCDEGSRCVREAAAKPQWRLVTGRDSSGALHVRATP